jgi:hypothetical protein
MDHASPVAHGTEMMGDFVGKKPPKQPEAPTLFTVIPAGAETSVRECHAITDFTLFAAAEDVANAEAMLSSIAQK